MLYDIFDKSLYRHDACFFGKQHALEQAMYHDNLEVCNILDSKAEKHEVEMFYY